MTAPPPAARQALPSSVDRLLNGHQVRAMLGLTPKADIPAWCQPDCWLGPRSPRWRLSTVEGHIRRLEGR